MESQTTVQLNTVETLNKPSLLSFDVKDLPAWQNQSYRQKQLATWIYDQGRYNFGDMTNVPKAWRGELLENYAVLPFVSTERYASKDGSTRYLFHLADGKKTEAVFMPYKNRKTLCISSMVGCPAGCSFCATGAMGFGRNLTDAEIIGQILAVAGQENIVPKDIRNVVLMGMGEALLNYDNALKAIKRMISPEALDMSPRRITLSTVGLPKQIRRLADEQLSLVLAVSLHAPDEDTRKQIIPTAHSHSLDEIKDALWYWQEEISRRITIEYTMLKGVNDHLWQAEALVDWLQGLTSHVNLIPFNSWQASGFDSTAHNDILQFQSVLEQAGISVSIRFSRGQDAGAACGQLALNN